MQKNFLRKQIFLPQDHGSWVFIFSPLLIGLFAGGSFSQASFYLILAALAAFLIRQPVTIAVKAWSGRRAKDDLRASYFWIAVYGCIILAATLRLVSEGFTYVLYLAVPSLPVFAWHLWLVSKREERKQINVEIVATGVLSLAAPAAYWVGIGRYDPAGWWLWILVWMQTAASIVYAYLRLEQREQDAGQIAKRTMEDGKARGVVHILQFRLSPDFEPARCFSKPSLHPILGTMGRDDVGYHPSRVRMETHSNWHPATHR